jgi:Protein of unknown function (DUF1592)/Protein of unknown function (DUF1588)/Protein of unknown function (DUF1595)/Protein of unknown function (DUF1585)/Protein of unknown function (DUF1587)
MKRARVRDLVAMLVLSGCQGVILGGRTEGMATGGGAQPAGGGGGSAATRLVCEPGTKAVASEGRRLTSTQYANAIAAIFDGQVAPSARYPAAFGASVTGFSTEPALGAVGSSTVDALLLAAEDVGVAVAAKLSTLLPCALASADEACANTFITTYARRAYRHAPTDAERAGLLKTFRDGRASGANFSEAIAMLTVHLLQTPQFVYVLEEAAPTSRRLSGAELASRLSFMLWDSVPDDALLAAAEVGSLSQVDALEVQANRLLDSDRADATLARFFREWTGTVRVTAQSKDHLAFPDFTDAVATSINASFDAFARDELRGHQPFSSLFQSSSVWVDDASATWLGVPKTGGWQRVSLDASKAAGLATQAAVMASLAHERNPSFILRGKFVLSKLLCQQFGTPPANANSVFDSLPLPADPTARDQSTQINANPTCSGCHATINPVGLAFEHFDATGRYRASYSSGKAIEVAGQLHVGGRSFDFADPAALLKEVGQSPEAVGCFARQLFRFTLSRPEAEGDGCALQSMGDALSAADGDLRSAVLSLVRSDAFRQKLDP